MKASICRVHIPGISPPPGRPSRTRTCGRRHIRFTFQFARPFLSHKKMFARRASLFSHTRFLVAFGMLFVLCSASPGIPATSTMWRSCDDVGITNTSASRSYLHLQQIGRFSMRHASSQVCRDTLPRSSIVSMPAIFSSGLIQSRRCCGLYRQACTSIANPTPSISSTTAKQLIAILSSCSLQLSKPTSSGRAAKTTAGMLRSRTACRVKSCWPNSRRPSGRYCGETKRGNDSRVPCRGVSRDLHGQRLHTTGPVLRAEARCESHTLVPMSSLGPIVTRFAPSPTGHLHIGGARSALFCWAFAKRDELEHRTAAEQWGAAASS